ncbi:MAG: FRG domain-containing protein [Phycisphaerales bacterium]|nr:FRG domain-containing protein [Phycisphaerales bacterium]
MTTESRIVQVTAFESATDFLAALNRSHPLWGGTFDGDDWIFRGHADAKWPLLPSLYRRNTYRKLKPVFDRMARDHSGLTYTELRRAERRRVNTQSPSEIQNRLGTVLENLESQMVSDFALVSERVGLALDFEHAWHYDRSQRSRWPSATLAIAQHHGVPTSLLDWTRNPRVAAFFACDGPKFGSRIAVVGLRAAVTCGRWTQHSVHEPVLALVQFPRFRSSFIAAQEGVFTSIGPGFVHDRLRQKGRIPNLIEALKAVSSDRYVAQPLLQVLTLPGNAADQLRTILWKDRVSRPHLMPTFDNVAGSLRQAWNVSGSFASEGNPLA